MWHWAQAWCHGQYGASPQVWPWKIKFNIFLPLNVSINSYNEIYFREKGIEIWQKQTCMATCKSSWQQIYLMIITWEYHDGTLNLLCQIAIIWLVENCMMKLATSQKCKLQMENYSIAQLSDETFLQRRITKS